MGAAEISRTPFPAPRLRTRFREIRTDLPVPESLPLLETLDRYESRSMHGQMPVVWAKAEGSTVEDPWGNRWIDFTSTIFVANAGHANPKVVAAVRDMLDRKLLHTYAFASEIRAAYLKRLLSTVPPYLEKAYLVSAGTEATEAALKLMRLWGQRTHPDKVGVVSFRGSMHGRTMGAEFLKASPEGTAWIGHEDPHIHPLPFPTDQTRRFHDDLEGLRASGVALDRLCGFFLESYIGWGALFFPTPYVKDLADYARRNGLLLVCDEIQGGFGRTGKFFAYEHYGVEPDLVCLGKGMSSGLPLAGVIGRREILDLPEVGSMSSTHSANPLCCAAGLANLEALASEGLVSEAERKGRLLFERLAKLQRGFPLRVARVEGKGLLAAIHVRGRSDGAPDGPFASRVCEAAMRRGLLLVHTGRESVKIGPPLSIPDEALEEGLDVLEESFSAADREDCG